jgi:hypothetical protein
VLENPETAREELQSGFCQAVLNVEKMLEGGGEAPGDERKRRRGKVAVRILDKGKYSRIQRRRIRPQG